MKKILFLLFVTVHAYGQNVDYNKIILPDHVQSPDFAEQLVQLAWKNNPLNAMLHSEVKAAEYQVKKNAGSWLDIFTVTGNLNQFNIDPDSDDNNRADFFPLYNIRASISLGMFVNIPYQTKIDKQRRAIAVSQVDARKLEIRNVVMKTYNDYLLKEKIYKIQAQVFSDVENAHRLVEQKFKNGETTFETYSASQRNYNQSSIILLTAETDYKNAKLDLEQLIGVNLEDVR
ncbi:MAG TPA: TolC family protein [Ohtaekwangia sp.]|nr:TolC family protein [Ohtaekwangia sp.]